MGTRRRIGADGGFDNSRSSFLLSRPRTLERSAASLCTTCLGTIHAMDLVSYAIVYFGVAASWIGIPIVGGAVLAGAGALAGDGQLDVWLVVAVATLGACTGGYAGYSIGLRAGAALAERPGRWQRQRARAISAGERFYRRWGPVAVFITPTWVSGALRMPRDSFLLWNAIAAVVSTLVTVIGAYAIVGAVLGHLSASPEILVLAGAGLAVAALGFALLWRRR
jgi:membrane protein DedA with SNARE-associated domain